MSLVDEIKSHLDIVEVAGSYLELQPAGRNWKALCPFHQEKTPSLVIFPDDQRWKCFGASCGRSGDVIDLVQQLEKWDFPETLHYLGSKVGVAVPTLDEGETRETRNQLSRQQVLSTAMQFFQKSLFNPDPEKPCSSAVSPGLQYARARGWSDETIRAAGLGSFFRDWEGLRRHLTSARVDLESPAAVALVGYRGDVAAWGKNFNLPLAQAWISAHKIPAIPPEVLLYPHLVRSRIVYVSARSLVGKGHWNPPSQLLGPRQPFFNHLFWQPDPDCGYIAIVEGQADAVTLAQWGLPAVALLGVAL